MTTQRSSVTLPALLVLGLCAAASSGCPETKPPAAAQDGAAAGAADGPAVAAKDGAAGPSAAKPPEEAPACKLHKSGKCCDPTIAAHLPKETVFATCAGTEAIYSGEQASADTCKYFFKVEGASDEDSLVQVYVPKQKEVPATPNDPFFAWKKSGKAFYTDRAKSPKSAPMLARATGLWLPGKGYIVSVNASVTVCKKPDAIKLATKIQ